MLPNFRYSKTALNQEDQNLILAGIQGLSSLGDSVKIKTLLAKSRSPQGDKMLLENDIIIDFTSWNHNSTLLYKINIIRTAIASHHFLEMDYYGGKGHYHRH